MKRKYALKLLALSLLAAPPAMASGPQFEQQVNEYKSAYDQLKAEIKIVAERAPHCDGPLDLIRVGSRLASNFNTISTELDNHWGRVDGIRKKLNGRFAQVAREFQASATTINSGAAQDLRKNFIAKVQAAVNEAKAELDSEKLALNKETKDLESNYCTIRQGLYKPNLSRCNGALPAFDKSYTLFRSMAGTPKTPREACRDAMAATGGRLDRMKSALDGQVALANQFARSDCSHPGWDRSQEIIKAAIAASVRGRPFHGLPFFVTIPIWRSKSKH
jgi:hypothetical protein